MSSANRGRRSRPWSATGGEVADLDGEVRIDTQVTASSGAAAPAGTDYRRLVEECRTTRAVAELADALGQPVGVTAAMVGRLRASGCVETRAPLDMTDGNNNVTVALLTRLRDRLHAI